MATEATPLATAAAGAPSPGYLALCLLGLLGTLGVYGFLQERIMATPYGGPGVFFEGTVFLVLCNRLFGAALACIVVTPDAKVEGPPLWKYALCSASNVLASALQYEALKYVAFAVQMVSKSCKILPVMVWGVLVSAKRYDRADWWVATAVTMGCLCFLLGGDLTAARDLTAVGPDVDPHARMHLLALGLTLSAASIACDGFTSMFQERLYEQYGITQWQQMLYMNLCSAGFCAVVLAAQPAGFAEPVIFAAHHPAFLRDVLVLSAAAAAGQVCIYSTIAWFGAVTFAALLNVRQVSSICLSTAYFEHPFTLPQLLGVVVTFGALGWRALTRGVALGRTSSPAKSPV